MSINQHDQSTGASAEELSLISLAFAPAIDDRDVRSLLKYLNGVTGHRFTGVYRFEPGWVVSVSLYDRDDPQVEVGANVPMQESYCWLTGLGDRHYVIEDAANDPRLADHVARLNVRAYVSVLLRDRTGQPWGTLCHFDHSPRQVPEGAMKRLESYRALVQELLVRDKPSNWNPDTPRAD